MGVPPRLLRPHPPISAQRRPRPAVSSGVTRWGSDRGLGAENPGRVKTSPQDLTWQITPRGPRNWTNELGLPRVGRPRRGGPTLGAPLASSHSTTVKPDDSRRRAEVEDRSESAHGHRPAPHQTRPRGRGKRRAKRPRLQHEPSHQREAGSGQPASVRNPYRMRGKPGECAGEASSRARERCNRSRPERSRRRQGLLA